MKFEGYLEMLVFLNIEYFVYRSWILVEFILMRYFWVFYIFSKIVRDDGIIFNFSMLNFEFERVELNY